MAALVALAGTGVALFGALNYMAPVDMYAMGEMDEADAPRLADPEVGLLGPVQPSEASDIWPALAGNGLHVRVARPSKDRQGALPQTRWNTRLPHTAALPKREVGLLRPGKRVSPSLGQASQDRIAWVQGQTLPQLLRPTAFAKNTSAPPAIRFAHPVA